MDRRNAPRVVRLAFTHDGRVQLALLAGYTSTIAAVVARVDDVQGNAAILRDWAVEPPAMPASQADLGMATDLRVGRLVFVADQVDADTLAFSAYPTALVERFREAFRADPAVPAEADAFARLLATDIRMFFHRSQSLARERLAGGAYLPVLEAYLAQLRAVKAIEDQNHFESLSAGIGGILDAEGYLLLSEDERARQLYLELGAERSALYQWYMQLAKGGDAFARG